MPDVSSTRRETPSAEAAEQRKLLQPAAGQKPFARALSECSMAPLRACGIEVLQVNVGRICNQTCAHCHVDAGPDREECMDRQTAQACIAALARTDIPTLDITGGAPEMNPHFRFLVGEARRLNRHVIDRSNLTVLQTPAYRDLPEFLAEQQVEIVASLPCYTAENTDAQRGTGVFDQSIAALRRLNALGYGRGETGLTLTLVYNPGGATLPPPQEPLEADYRRELKDRYGVVFDRLFTITNLPVGRFLRTLLADGQYETYMQQLIDAFNPATVPGVMCRWTVSVQWNGRLHDCDFNQLLQIGLAQGLPDHIRDFDFQQLARRRIQIGQHCYGCTAGAGSSCQGAIEH